MRIPFLLTWGSLIAAVVIAPSAGAQSASTPGAGLRDPSTSKSVSPQRRDRRYRLEWKRNFGTFDYTYTALIFAGSVVFERTSKTRTEPNWTGPILFDEAAQSLFLGKTKSGRRQAQNVSGYLTITPQIAAVVDAAAVPLLFDRLNFKVALYMSLVNIQAMSLNGLLSRLGHRGIARERPDTSLCLDDDNFSDRCGKGEYSSFPSGHTSTAFVGAGLVCAHHMAFRLYWHPAVDAAACIVQLGIASSAGLLRVATGRHYLSDVVAGAGLGLLTGFVTPTLMYYRNNRAQRNDTAMNWMLVPAVTTRSLGLGVAGLF